MNFVKNPEKVYQDYLNTREFINTSLADTYREWNASLHLVFFEFTFDGLYQLFTGKPCKTCSGTLHILCFEGRSIQVKEAQRSLHIYFLPEKISRSLVIYLVITLFFINVLTFFKNQLQIIAFIIFKNTIN